MAGQEGLRSALRRPSAGSRDSGKYQEAAGRGTAVRQTGEGWNRQGCCRRRQADLHLSRSAADGSRRGKSPRNGGMNDSERFGIATEKGLFGVPFFGSWKFYVDDPGVCDSRILASSMPEHPAAQQVEPGPSVHLTLDDLEPVDLALDLAVAPRFGQRGTHRILIAPEANGARALAP